MNCLSLVQFACTLRYYQAMNHSLCVTPFNFSALHKHTWCLICRLAPVHSFVMLTLSCPEAMSVMTGWNLLFGCDTSSQREQPSDIPADNLWHFIKSIRKKNKNVAQGRNMIIYMTGWEMHFGCDTSSQREQLKNIPSNNLWHFIILIRENMAQRRSIIIHALLVSLNI